MSTKHTGSAGTRARRRIAQALGRWLDKAIDGPLSETDQAFSQPSDEALSRYGSIPLLFNRPARVPVVECPILYDSSTPGQLIGLRNATDGHLRRVRFGVGDLEMEIVAERRDKAWEFVARVYQEGEVAHRFVLRAGARKLMADAGGFFHWTSETVPRHMRLMSFEQEIACEVLPW